MGLPRIWSLRKGKWRGHRTAAKLTQGWGIAWQSKHLKYELTLINAVSNIGSRFVIAFVRGGCSLFNLSNVMLLKHPSIRGLCCHWRERDKYTATSCETRREVPSQITLLQRVSWNIRWGFQQHDWLTVTCSHIYDVMHCHQQRCSVCLHISAPLSVLSNCCC
jgi:hypothetical protein